MGALVWRVMGTGSAVLAGVAARNALQKLWTGATGKQPPANPADPQVSWAEALGWAVASGAAIQVARLLATRQAARYYKRSAGHLPKGMQQVQ